MIRGALRAIRSFIDRLSPAEEDAARVRARNVGPSGDMRPGDGDPQYTSPEQRVLAAARAVAAAHAAYDASGHPDDFVKLKRALADQDEAVQALGARGEIQ